jgi:large subunit ribosomal protein LP0
MKVTKVLQDNAIFDAAVLDLTVDSILAKFKKAIKIQAQLSLGAGLPSAASAPHSILNAFKNLAAVSAMSGYEFKEAAALLAAAASAPAGGAGGAAAAKVEVKEEAAKEEAEAVDMGNLFGDDDEY